MSKRAEIVSQTFNGKVQWIVGGGYFKLINTVNAVRVELFLRGQLVLLAAAVSEGFYQRIEYDRVEITTGGNELVEWLYAPDEGGSDQFSGSVTISGTPAVTISGTASVGIAGAAFTPAAKTVTTASAQLLAANAARRYLFIQNQDPAGNIWIRTTAAAAVADATCVKIPPGGYWEPLVPPTGELRAIGDIASNANVNVQEA